MDAPGPGAGADSLRASGQDTNVTDRLAESGKVMGVQLLDYLLIRRKGYRFPSTTDYWPFGLTRLSATSGWGLTFGYHLNENLQLTAGYLATVNDGKPDDLRMDGFKISLVYGWHPLVEGIGRLGAE